MKEYKEYLVSWIKEQVFKANAKGVVIGVSGGIDSAVVSLLAKEAFPHNHECFILPISNSQEDLFDAQQHCKQHALNYQTINLENSLVSLTTMMPDFSLKVKANMKARLRMITLYAFAQHNNYLVLGTDNACEWYTGYFTKYGDGGVDLAPLLHLLKEEVYELAKLLNVSKSILVKEPTAGLIDDQTDEMEMGFSYRDLDAYLRNEQVSEEVVKKIELLHTVSEHKRNLPKVPSKKLRR